jgi:tRNA-2-methylthio-N6-dimethylallyladenosine synthase
VVAERYQRLAALVEDVTLAENEAFTGREVEVLVAEGEGRKDGATHRLSGRARDNRLVHFAPAATAPRPGDVITTTVTRAAPHYLIADGPPRSLRSTRGGDAWQARQASPASPPGPAAAPAVSLGMPAVGRPAGPHPA